MAKKEKQKAAPTPEESKKRYEKYAKACESEKKSKATAMSIIGFSLLCFAVLLVVILKMNGVGKTIVFDNNVTNSDGNVTPYTTDTVDGTTLADYIADQLTTTSQQ